MTQAKTYIAGDWGTSHLRLFLCSEGQVLERRTGPGAAQLTPGPEAFGRTLTELTDSWVRAHGRIPVWLAGMVGARSGWRESPYVRCPADVSSVAASMLRFDMDGQQIAITPGAGCINPHGAPDVMRGEETQIFGTLAQQPALARGRRVFVLPGTHAKWVLVEDGRILRFQTSLSGELYALLRDRSTLARASSTATANVDAPFDYVAFERGARRARELHTVPLHHLLFETRSRQLIEGVSREEALAFLSGLIIGQDVAGALGLFGGACATGASVPLLGAPDLCQLYSSVLADHGVEATIIDATDATLSGLHAYAALADRKETARANAP